LHSGIK